jgi:ferritin-like metal-binding protein YciE
MKVRNLTDLFLHELIEIYSAEHHLRDALPAMEKIARHADLKKSFHAHAIETEHQISRIEQILDILGLDRKKSACKAMKGLIEDGQSMIHDASDDRAADAALIATAQKIEHYEIASYGTLIALARTLGYDNAVVILKESMDEERSSDETLTRLAMDEGINREALKKVA